MLDSGYWMKDDAAGLQGNIQHPVSGIRYRVSRAMDERSTA
jgi:hypothetical protein